MSDTFFRHTQIGINNPGRLTDDEIEKAFITRKGVFKYLFQKIIAEEKNSIPQHYIVIGQRGMGKSTLLHRIAVELRKEPHKIAFIPLTYPEEQYNVDRLSKFWLNTLDALGDALDKEGSTDVLDELDKNVQTWANNAKNISADEMYQHFEGWCKRIERRAILLVDNLNLIFDRLSKPEQHELRAILMENNAPILLGASTTTIEDTIQYGAPFYDAFQMTYLKKLTFEQTLDILRNLAEMTGNQRFLNSFMAYKGRLRSLYTLTGGTPRTLVMLYPLIQDGFSIDVQNDLENLMDVATPLYKARFEELPAQMQVIVDAVALNWDPIHLSELRTTTQLENTQLAPQLKRLTDGGWLQKQDAYKAKGKSYEISERFFNIWYLMRRSSRRQKKELLCLTKFLVTLYGEELPKIGRTVLNKKSKNADQISLNLALADGIRDEELAEKLRIKSFEELLSLSKKDKSLLSNFSIPKFFINKKEKELLRDAFLMRADKHHSKAIEKLNEIIHINPNSDIAWDNIGAIYHDNLNDMKNAEIAFNNAIKINKENAFAWNGIGNVLIEDPKRYKEAEKAYLKSIDIDKNFAEAWNGLGTFYHQRSNDFQKAEEAYKNAISINNNEVIYWNNLGDLYHIHLNDYKKAEKAYMEAIKIDSSAPYIFNNLGNLKQDHLDRFEEAEQEYKKAIDFGDDTYIPNCNLIFLYRDKMNRIVDAKEIFKTLKPDGKAADTYWLHDSLFALYEQNLGIAKKSLLNALHIISGELPDSTKDDWWRYAAIVHKLGHAEDVLKTIKESGNNISLKPYFTAIQALTEKTPEAFLNSKAVEIREPAKFILEKIKKYQ